MAKKTASTKNQNDILQLKNEVIKKAEELQDAGKLPDYSIDILRPIGPSLLNRGFDNKAKTVVIGGVPRITISSQCRKYSIRKNSVERNAYHTSGIVKLVCDRLESEGSDEAYIESVTKLLKNVFAGKDNKKYGYKTSLIYAVGEEDINAVIKAVKDALPKTTDDEKEIKKAADEVKMKLTAEAESRALSENVALFGRMSTDPVFSTVYGAVNMGRSYSVDEYAMDTDDWSAVDDYMKAFNFADDTEQKQSGSANLGTTDIASNTMYEYAVVSTKILFENLMRGKDVNNEDDVNATIDKCNTIVKQFIKDFIFVMPVANQTTKAARDIPAVVYLTKGNSQPRQMDCVFEKVITGDSDKSVCDRAVERFTKDIYDRHCGAFADYDYYSEAWLSDNYDLPDSLKDFNIQRITVKDLDNFVR